VAEIRQLQGVHQGHVRLMAMDSHSTSFLPALVERLAQTRPGVSLSIDLASSDDAASEILSGKAELAAVFNLPPRREFLVLWRGELPFGCVVAPAHPLAQGDSVSLQQAAAYPIALQSKSLAIRRYLEAHYSWLFAESRGRLETNSLQLVKQLARSGRYVAFTSELDAAPDLRDGSLRFLPVRDKNAEPQSISVVVDAAKPLRPLIKLIAQQLSEAIEGTLASVRAAATARA